MTAVPPAAPPALRDDVFVAAGRDVRQTSPNPHDHDILTTAEASPRLGVFVDFMRAAALAGLLLGCGPFTVLAPTERAFLKLSLRERDALLADPRRLSRVMRGHILTGRLPSPVSGQSMGASTVDGEPRLLTSIDGTPHVDTARIVQGNIHASNGLIHAIDLLLL
jgi:uncharacterized surface protein with fasciclin (FAS1) repeats